MVGFCVCVCVCVCVCFAWWFDWQWWINVGFCLSVFLLTDFGFLILMVVVL